MIDEKYTIDIHTHILPDMDDGASSTEESLQLLAELSKQGISTVVATPHFYADQDSPQEFFDRRQKSVSSLADKLDGSITVLTGAEVLYYQGISRTESLSEFTLGSTNLLLLEMPFCDWTSSMVNEVYSIQRDRNFQVVIAHIDRYLTRKNKEYIGNMLDFEVLFQVNATAFLDKKQRNIVLNMLKSRSVHFVASDCHNMTLRPPKLSDAYSVIERKIGTEYVQYLKNNCDLYFGRGDK